MNQLLDIPPNYLGYQKDRKAWRELNAQVKSLETQARCYEQDSEEYQNLVKQIEPLAIRLFMLSRRIHRQSQLWDKYDVFAEVSL